MNPFMIAAVIAGGGSVFAYLINKIRQRKEHRKTVDYSGTSSFDGPNTDTTYTPLGTYHGYPAVELHEHDKHSGYSPLHEHGGRYHGHGGYQHGYGYGYGGYRYGERSDDIVDDIADAVGDAIDDALDDIGDIDID